MNVYGQLIRAQLEVRTSDHVGTIPGMVWFHNTEKRIKFSEATNVVSLLANDDKAVFGTSGTAAENLRFHRSGVGIFQFVLGDDVTAEGSVAIPAQLDTRLVNYTNAGRPAFGNDGRVIWNTDAGRVEVDSGAAWDPIGSGAGGLKIEAAEHDCDARHNGVKGPGFDNFVCEAFDDPKEMIEGFLMDDLAASATTLYVSWQPVWLDSANKNTNHEAGFLAVSGTSAGSITTTGTFKIGTSATQFSKTSGTSSGFIQHDLGSGNEVSLAGNGLWIKWINLSTTTNVDTLAVRFTEQGDNPTIFSEFVASTQHNGSAFVTGWNLVSWDLRDPSIRTDTGGGWPSFLVRTYAWGVNTLTTTQTLDLIGDAYNGCIRGPNDVHKDYERYGQAGNEYDIIDNSNREALIIDSASARIVGDVTLDTGPTNSYTGGTSSIFTRGSLEIQGDNRSRYQATSPLIGADLSSGASDLTQTIRIKKQLKETLSAASVTTSVTFDTELYFDVSNGAATATTIELVDPVNQSAELLSGDVLHIVNVIDNDGKFSYVYSGNDFTLTANSSWSADVLTLTGSAGDVTNTATGDLLVKKGPDMFLSVVTGASTDEAFGSALTRDEIIVTDPGLPFPPGTVGYYHLGGTNTTEASKNRETSPDLANLTVNGSGPNIGEEFKLGLLGSSTYSASNYYSLTNAESTLLEPDTTGAGLVCLSFWVLFEANTAAQRFWMARGNGSTTGWAVESPTTTSQIRLILGGSVVATSPNLSLGVWHHIGVYMEDGVASALYHDNNKITGSGSTIAVSANDFRVGSSSTGGGPLAANEHLHGLLLTSGTDIQNQFGSIYANGLSRLLGSNAGFKYRNVSQSQSGNKLSAKLELPRETNAVSPFVTSFLAGETS